MGLQILFIVLSGLATEIISLLDYKWHDKRTLLFKRVRLCLLIVILPALMITSIVTTVDSANNAAAEREQSRASIQQLKKDRDSDAQAAAQRDAELLSSNRDLIATNKELKAALAPFEALARVRFPDTPIEDAMIRLRDQLEAISRRTTTLEKKADVLNSVAVTMLIDSETAPREPFDEPSIAVTQAAELVTETDASAYRLIAHNMSQKQVSSTLRRSQITYYATPNSGLLGRPIRCLEQIKSFQLPADSLKIEAETKPIGTSLLLTVNGTTLNVGPVKVPWHPEPKEAGTVSIGRFMKTIAKRIAESIEHSGEAAP